MTRRRYYRGAHNEQRRTGPMSTTNCAAASGAWLVDQWTLGLVDPPVRRFRRLTEDTEGGLRMEQIAAVMESDYGMTVRLYDYRDDLKADRLWRYLSRGWFAVVAGDYDVLPGNLKGADYDGFHAVGYHQRYTANQAVMDPLLDDWVRWPRELAYRYIKRFDRQVAGGIHAAVMVPRYARPRDGILELEVRSQPSKTAPVIATLKAGRKLVTGGTVDGDTVAGVDRWRRVWAGSMGYVPWSQTWQQG